MASFALHPETKLFIGADATVTPVTDFATKLPQLDKSGLPVFKINADIIFPDGSVTHSTIKVITKDAFVLAPRTEYAVKGVLAATPYLPDGANRIATSFKVYGELAPAKPFRTE